MKIRLFFFIQLLFMFASNSSVSQENIDSIYGLNPVLYNGQIYAYSVPPSVVGHQYLEGKDYTEGSISLVNESFDELSLNYDVYNQEIILKFDLNHRTIIIKLFKDRINQFTLGNKSFELVLSPDSVNTIYQVFGNGNYKLLHHWKKGLNLSNVSGTSNYVFSKPGRTMHLKKGDQIVKYKNNRTFLSAVDVSNKTEVKNFIKQNKINVKKASDVNFNRLINFCNTL